MVRAMGIMDHKHPGFVQLANNNIFLKRIHGPGCKAQGHFCSVVKQTKFSIVEYKRAKSSYICIVYRVGLTGSQRGCAN
jgi:hypothetical protein